MDNMEQAADYKKIITRLAEEHIDARIPNGLPQHASILIEAMFLNASEEIRVFTKNLSDDVFGVPDVVSAVKKFLSKPCAKLKILLQQPSDLNNLSTHPLLDAFFNIRDKEMLHGTVEIRNATGSYTKDEANHFTVMDNDSFRFETDHHNCKAVANFNEPKIAKKLITAFDSAFSMAKTTPPLFELKAS